MTNPNKVKGSRFESEVVDVLQANGHPYAERRHGNGVHDRGDITGIPGTVWECKNVKRMALAEWMDEAEVEAVNAGVDLWVVVVKRPRRSASEAYAVMPLAMLSRLLADDE